MVEYLYDAIRCSAGTYNMVNAYITDESDNLITEGCYFVIHSTGLVDEIVARIEGKYDSELGVWEFHIGPEVSNELRGRYMYCIMKDDTNLCFKQPIYFM